MNKNNRTNQMKLKFKKREITVTKYLIFFSTHCCCTCKIKTNKDIYAGIELEFNDGDKKNEKSTAPRD